MTRPRIWITAALLGTLAVLGTGAAAAATELPPPTSEQIEQFRQLPPDQQQRLIEQFREATPTEVTEPPLSQPETVVPGDAPVEQDATDEVVPEEQPALRDEATGLVRFGYDVFAGAPTTFAPVTDIPVPTDYVLGPGDMVAVQLFGKTPGNFTLAVNRDGSINFPELGPINVAGLTFDQMREMLQERVASQMIGVTASITLGELRSIRVFVLGEANTPGSYTVSSLSTITNALLTSGGVKSTGTLRNIELKRAGTLVGTLDLYDLLLRGDTSGDARLMPGDVIFIPPVGTQVGVDGDVLRPAIYELQGETTVGDVVQLAGGLLPTAYPQGARLSRIDANQARIQQDVDLRLPAGQGSRIRKGDVLTVPSVLGQVDNVLTLQGQVLRPGPVQYQPGMRLSDVIPSIDDLQPLADLNYVSIRRETMPDRRIVALSADLQAALANRGGPADVLLMPRDQIRVFAISDTRPELEPLLDDLRLQANFDEAAPLVRVGGRVRAAGTYPLEPGMRVSDLLRAGGALSESAYAVEAELTRYVVLNGDQRQVDLQKIDLAAIRRGDAAADLELNPYDFLNVREVTDWREQETVEMKGEVRFPGSYPIRRGETLLSVLERAGGLTEWAYPNGAVFTRVSLRQREERQITQMIERMEADIATLSLQQAQSPESAMAGSTDTVTAGQGLLAQLRSATPVGRLAMDFPRLTRAAPGSPQDVTLEDGDVLMVPGPIQSITVVGEVQSPTSLLHDTEYRRDDYINLSGGLTRRADANRIYVVRANGQVTAGTSRRWFRTDQDALMPGDTIVVPADLERMRPLPLWTSVSSIIFNLAVAVAAVNSF